MNQLSEFQQNGWMQLWISFSLVEKEGFSWFCDATYRFLM